MRTAVLPGMFSEPAAAVPPIVAEKRRQASNRDKVLAHLQQHGAAMNYDLVRVGGLRAMARVHELQRAHDITVTQVKGGAWRVEYRGPREGA